MWSEYGYRKQEKDQGPWLEAMILFVIHNLQ